MRWECGMSAKQIGGSIGGVLLFGMIAYTCLPLFDGRMQSLGKRLGKDVANVTKASDSGAYSPVIVLEETHGSPLQQVEEAIVLTRALGGENLREIVLEGYLIDKSAIDWKSLHDRATPTARGSWASSSSSWGWSRAASSWRWSSTTSSSFPERGRRSGRPIRQNRTPRSS